MRVRFISLVVVLTTCGGRPVEPVQVAVVQEAQHEHVIRIGELVSPRALGAFYLDRLRSAGVTDALPRLARDRLGQIDEVQSLFAEIASIHFELVEQHYETRTGLA